MIQRAARAGLIENTGRVRKSRRVVCHKPESHLAKPDRMTDPNQLFVDMQTHPDCGPVFELLNLADGCDTFSRALALVRDCFSPDSTLRALSRDKLRKIMKLRTAAVFAYEGAVMKAARDAGHEPEHFGDALKVLEPDVTNKLHADFLAQIEALKLRSLSDDSI